MEVKILENTSIPILRQLDNVFLIDWLTVVFHGIHVDDLQELLGLSNVDWQTTSHFINGYPMDTFFSNIHIRWGADDPAFYKDTVSKSGTVIPAASKVRYDMGICLDLSGQGCRAFEEFSKLSWFDLMAAIFSCPGRCSITRLDLAYDDHSGLLNIWQMKRDVEDRNYISKSKKSMLIWSDDQENDIQGLTIQIGSKSSPVLIRIYNKAAERGFGKEKHWIRVELQLREDRAQEAFRLLHERQSIGLVASGIIRNYCCFVTPTTDSNKSRGPVAEYWQRVLEGMEKLRVWIAPGEPYNFSKAENHMIHQYGQFIQAYAMIHGSLGSLEDRARAMHKDLKPKYRNAIATALTEQKLRREHNEEIMMDLFGADLDDSEFFGYVQSNFAELLEDDPNLPFD